MFKDIIQAFVAAFVLLIVLMVASNIYVSRMDITDRAICNLGWSDSFDCKVLDFARDLGTI